VGQNLLDVEPWHYVAFGALIVGLLMLDLAVFHRRAHAPGLAESVAGSLAWIGLALAFNGLVWWWGWLLRGSSEAGVTFLTGFLVEKSLSVDNLFVFALIFRFFRTPRRYQYRVLFWGVLGAILLRLLFILAGVGLIRRFQWLLWILGLFLVYSSFKLAFGGDSQVDPEKNLLLRAARRWLRVTREDHGPRFFARENGLLAMTPLFLVLMVVESSDVLFAVDSVPAILGITQDAFLVFTSNIFAVLGLRALYFLLADAIDRFRYLHFGLSLILFLLGTKMIGQYWLKDGWPAIAPGVWLLVIAAILAGSVGLSWAVTRRDEGIGN
jgi:tellurite resistance protein TerC